MTRKVHHSPMAFDEHAPRFDGKRLRYIRDLRGMAQSDLAIACRPLTDRMVSRYETGVATPAPPTFARLVKALRTSADYLLGLTDDPEPPIPLSAHVRAVVKALEGLDEGSIQAILRMVTALKESARHRNNHVQ